MNKTRNRLLKMEIKSFLKKAIVAKINCYKINYSANRGSFLEDVLDKYREDEQVLLQKSIENIEFVFVMSHPGNKIKMEMIIGVRPIVSPSLEKEVINANLQDMYLHHDNIKIYNICNEADILKAVKEINTGNVFTNHTFVKYSWFFQQMSSSLTDFLMGYFEKEKDQIRTEKTRFSDVKGNYNDNFDVYSIFYLIKIFLVKNGMKIKDKGVYESENDIYVMSIDKLIDIALVDFIHDNFDYQTNLIDIENIILRQKKEIKLLIESFLLYNNF